MKSLEEEKPRRSPRAIAVALLLGFTGLFTIPFFLPVKPAISDSYRYGFNNHAVLVLFVILATAFAWWSGGLDSASPPSPAPQTSRKPLWLALLLTAALTTSMALAMRPFGVINEAAYLTDRLRQLAAGQPLFTGFEFIYGPTILYLPLALSHLLHLEILDAYYLSWILSWLAGVCMIWATIRLAAPASPRCNTLFLYFFLSFLPGIVSYGTNYTPLRFIAPAFFAALVWRTIEVHRRPATTAAAAAGALAWLLFYSPETGLAFFAGTLLFLALFFGPKGRQALAEAVAVFLAGSALLAFAGFRIHLFDSMQSMSSGGYNLPLLPSIGSLIVLLLWITAACLLARTLLARRRLTLIDYLILVGLCGLPGALGRCDPGHMFSNTLAAILAVWIVLSARPNGGKLIWGTYALASLTLPLFLYQSNNFLMMPVKFALLSPGDPQPRLRRLATAGLEHALGPRRTAAELVKWNAEFPRPNPDWNTPATQPLRSPLGYRSNLRVRQPMPPLTNGFFFGLANVMQASQVQAKIDELKTHPADLLLFTGENHCDAPASAPTNHIAEDRESRRQLLLNLQPFYLPGVRHRDDPTAALCAYILANYRPTAFIPPYDRATVWQRTSASPN